jgi:hypothetical protein
MHLGTGAAVLSHEVYGSVWDCGLKGIGVVEGEAVEGEAVSLVTGPAIVGHKEPLINFAKNSGFDSLSF